MGFPNGSDGKESACNMGRPGFGPQVGKISYRRERLPTPVFWPEELHGQRSLVGYGPWGHKERDFHFSFLTYKMRVLIAPFSQLVVNIK